jgi:opacity protein-like surface antigen
MQRLTWLLRIAVNYKNVAANRNCLPVLAISEYFFYNRHRYGTEDDWSRNSSHQKTPPMRSSPLLFSMAVATCFLTVSAKAQFTDASYEVGVSAGAVVYQGDLTPSALGSYRTLRPVLNLWGSKRFTQNFSVRANLALGSIHGDDARYSSPEWRKERNLNFTTSITELSALGVWDIDGGRRRFSPYVFAGAGFALVRVHRDASGFNAAYFADDKPATEGLATDLARTTPRLVPVIPIGAGIRYTVNDQWSVHAETSYRLSHTDYLDGFSQAGNPSRYDHYQTWTIGLSYRFGGGGSGGVGCPVFKQ